MSLTENAYCKPGNLMVVGLLFYVMGRVVFDAVGEVSYILGVVLFVSNALRGMLIIIGYLADSEPLGSRFMYDFFGIGRQGFK